LGYHAFGKLQIIQAARESTLSKGNAIDYTEDNHEIQTFLDRLFKLSATPVQKIAWSENPTIATRAGQADVQDTAVISLVKRAIKAGVAAGNMVIIGRGGQVLLQDTPGVLHVRIEAPVNHRIEWVKGQLKKEGNSKQAEEALRRAALEIINHRDTASADYIKRYFNDDWHNPRLYHLVLNLGKLNVAQAVQIIAAGARSLETQTQPSQSV
jgi:cytidylate kinase